MFRVAVVLVLVSALVLAEEDEDTGAVEYVDEPYEDFLTEEEYEYLYVDDSSTTPANEDGEGTTVKPDLPL